MPRVLVLGCVLLAGLAGLGRAAEAPPPAALSAVIATPEHRAALLAAVRAIDRSGAAACPESGYVATGPVSVFEPVQAGSGGKLQAGAWKEQVRETGCGSGRLLNALSFVTPAGTVQTVPMLPGTSIADPQLQHDSVQYAGSAMGGLPPGCENGTVLNTTFLTMEGLPAGVQRAPDATPRPWTELWTLGACAKRVDVDMHFKPDDTGTEIRAELHK